MSIIFLLFPRPPIVIVLELALRRRGAGATGGIGGGKRDIVVEAAAASASLHCGKNKSISSPTEKLDEYSAGKYRVHDGQTLIGVLLLAQRPLQRRRHGFREAG